MVGKYINGLADIVRERIKNTLLEKIGIMFDGWTSNSIHFVGLFGIYQTVHEPRKLVLLAFLPFEDCTTQDADFLKMFWIHITRVLTIFFFFQIMFVLILIYLLIDEYPDLEDRLGKSASIIHDSTFEEAVIKILCKQEATLTSNEKQKVKSFIVEQSEQSMVNEGPITMKKHVAKKHKLEESKYMDMNINPLISNAVERLFSVVKYYYTDWRKSFDLYTLDNLLLLRINGKIWSIQNVHQIKH
ncbi:hypothetical protein C2G38_2306825 [Gigaspora rosea]|uniref:Uncharacterized protein n=1 Tax=Gigaspora rosea TaxID=44941 RepID=A0A397W6W6_9GLOM|nr:hypothetical protein C2G38_2306825 [Gigaspora rosea]